MLALLFPSITDCISTFASKISILSVIFHNSEFYFFKLIGILKIHKIRKNFLKSLKFAFSICVMGERDVGLCTFGDVTAMWLDANLLCTLVSY